MAGCTRTWGYSSAAPGSGSATQRSAAPAQLNAFIIEKKLVFLWAGFKMLHEITIYKPLIFFRLN